MYDVSFPIDRPAPTYETASTRKFYHGRTETVRSCTVEAVEWCTSMLDPTIKVCILYHVKRRVIQINIVIQWL